MVVAGGAARDRSPPHRIETWNRPSSLFIPIPDPAPQSQRRFRKERRMTHMRFLRMGGLRFGELLVIVLVLAMSAQNPASEPCRAAKSPVIFPLALQCADH